MVLSTCEKCKYHDYGRDDVSKDWMHICNYFEKEEIKIPQEVIDKSQRSLFCPLIKNPSFTIQTSKKELTNNNKYTNLYDYRNRNGIYISDCERYYIVWNGILLIGELRTEEKRKFEPNIDWEQCKNIYVKKAKNVEFTITFRQGESNEN